MLQDIKFALVLLWKQKAFTFAALVTLALCIGTNTAVFTLLNTVVLRELPFPESDRLVMMYNVYPAVGIADRGGNAVPDYLDRVKLTEVFEEVALVGIRGYDVGSDGATVRIDGEYVTPSYFRVLRMKPLLGRTFDDSEAVQGNDRVVILSEALWAERFGRDPNVIGRDIRLSGVTHTIIGVMPEAYRAMTGPRRLWVPFVFTPEQTSDDSRHTNSWGMIASLTRGVTIGQAKQRIDALNHTNLDLFPKYRSMLENARFETKVVFVRDQMVRGIKAVLYLLQIAVLGVLLIGCVNLANLMLVRTSGRLKELAIRYSLGAGRWRLARQLLGESLTVSLLGGGLGLIVAVGGVELLAWLGAQDLPRGANMHIDSEVLIFAIVVTVLAGLACGSIPLLHLFKRDLNLVFRGYERGGTAGRQVLSLRSALVVAQVSLAFVLLVVSGLLTVSFMRVLKVSLGFETENVASARFSLPKNRYPEDGQRRETVTTLLEKVRSIPGVSQAGITTYLPLSGARNASGVMIEGRALEAGELPPVPGWNTIDTGYLDTMRIPLLAGRNFTDGDRVGSLPVVLIDQFMAQKYWPDGNAIGSRIHEVDKTEMFTVIGIVGTVKTSDLAELNAVGQVYFHYKQKPPDTMHIVVRRDAHQTPLVGLLRTALAEVDPEVALFDTKTMSERLSESLLDRQGTMLLCAIFAGLALLLSAIGIYGVLAYNVTQRTREIGIRMALGATARDVLRMVLGQGVKVTGIGLLIGGAFGYLLTGGMASVLYGVEPHDPLVFVLTGALLAVVALVASFIPSLRAVWIQPSTALRQE